MPVQWVNRPNLDFRGFAGQIASGAIAPGDRVRITPGGKTSRVARIVTMDGDAARAVAGQSVTVTLADEIDCSRGDVIAAADAAPELTDHFTADIVWMDDTPLQPGRAYWLKLATQTVSATVAIPHHQIDVNSFAQLPAATLALNAIGHVDLRTDRPLACRPYRRADGRIDRVLGGFILIDKLTNATVAAGMVVRSLRTAGNIHWQSVDIGRDAHARQKGQSPRLLWFTGLSGAGKSTIANLVEKRLFAMGRHSFLLDGDNIRHGLCRDLGFSDGDRAENIRRVGEVARLMSDAGLIVLSAFISPFRAERAMVRAMMPPGEFIEIFVDTPLAVAEARDEKGLYRKARAGELPHFTGIDSPYEPPEQPDIHIDTTRMTAAEAAELIVEHVVGIWSHDL
jgi:bifunctional enzyme CysN/CysC